MENILLKRRRNKTLLTFGGGRAINVKCNVRPCSTFPGYASRTWTSRVERVTLSKRPCLEDAWIIYYTRP
jgi:hypothetical protein